MTTGDATTSGATLRGGAWLLDRQSCSDVFTPERMTEEHRLIAQTVTGFVTTEVLPVLDRLDQKDWTLARALVRRAAELGILGADVAEADGGLHTDTAASMIVSERMSQPASFGATLGAQVTLTILPLVLFGTPAQKREYLPRLLSGELLGAYCLSEPGSGSDALGARTRATREADGTFVLNGEKMWITNGGFADVFIVFAKVDGEHFSAFIVERAFGGLTSGKEEHKLGLHGSSTTAVRFADVRVPAGNLLGEVGKGHKIAFNVLNFARLKLGAMCAGGAHVAIGESARYAAARRQFGQPIASFGAIKHKIGEMVVRTYAADSLNYRTVGLIDVQVAARTEPDHAAALLAALEEYAVEASISKVAGSEALDFVLDENIQIHGGNGYVRDYPAERHYRDGRVNRIFEGTNEINRLLIPSVIARRAAAAGGLAIGHAGAGIESSGHRVIGSLGDRGVESLGDEPWAPEIAAVDGFKRAALVVLGTAMEAYGKALANQQEVLLHAADVLIDVFSAESALLRARAASGAARGPLHADVARVFLHDAALRIAASSRQALSATIEGDELLSTLLELDTLLRPPPLNTAALRRRIADETVARGSYPL